MNAAGLAAVRQKYPTDARGKALTGAGYSVAVIDSGIDYRHPALGGGFGAGKKVVAGYDFVDGRHGGYDEGDSTSGPDGDPMDPRGHGTHATGIIGSTDSEYGGVAPGVNLIGLRVLDKNGSGQWTWVESALRWVRDNRSRYNIAAVNLSLGLGVYNVAPNFPVMDGLIKELTDAGVVVVAAAGNNYIGNESVGGLQYPAINPNVISVGAVYDGDYGSRTWSSGARDDTTGVDRVASFSQRGAALDLLAPGALIRSTGLTVNGKSGFSDYGGTSQAAPFVAGAAVLLRQALDSLGRPVGKDTVSFIRDTLVSTGDVVYDGDDEADNVVNSKRNYHRLNIAKALNRVLGAAGSTTSDAREPNATPAQATNLGRLPTDAASTLTGLSFHHSFDVDWFRFEPT
ncbi:MAG: S8 family serine peptidase, partial [Planctomycetia bacterium]